jgi:hypothetical protein
MVIQESVVVAVQEHAVPVITLADWRLSVESTENAVFEIEYEHCAEAGDASTIQNSATNAQQRGMLMCPPGTIAGRARGRIVTVHALRRRKASDNRLRDLELPV